MSLASVIYIQKTPVCFLDVIYCIFSISFKIVSLTLIFSSSPLLCLVICPFTFIMLGVCKSYYICGQMSLNGLGKLFTSISSILLVLHFHSPLLWDSSHMYINHSHCFPCVICILFCILFYFFSPCFNSDIFCWLFYSFLNLLFCCFFLICL